MDSRAKQDRQFRAVAIAIVASIATSVAVMLFPADMIESFASAIGVSRFLPATAAARALIAFVAGALTLAVMAAVLLRGETQTDDGDWTAAGIPETDDDLTPTWKERFASLGLPPLKLPQMPWKKHANATTEFADLPKIKNGDSHPDAPPRHPLLASQDLPVLELSETAMEPFTSDLVEENAVVESFESIAAEPIDTQLSLADMVAQLEASVAQRQQQLADLEVVAANLAASKMDERPVAVDSATSPSDLPEPASEPEMQVVAELPRQIRPVVAAVPDAPPRDDDMDAALAAALATLHRMNGTGG